jgi:dipeptidyl aminopeptidase/acylaminoacyl peptidase
MKKPLLMSCALLLANSVLADTSANLDTLKYQDIFNLEFAANPTVMNATTVLYERHSMDIMRDTRRTNLWFVDLEDNTHYPLLSDSKNHFSPVLSSDKKRLAYLSSKEDKIQIYVRQLDNGATTKVTDVAMTPSQMAFSPDGKQIAFVMFTPTKTKPLFALDFKPDGAKWASSPQFIEETLFQRDGRGMNKPGTMQVYIVPTIGGTPRQISSGEYDYNSQISWSHDGKKLYVSANIRDDRDFDVFNTDVLALDISTGEQTVLTNDSGPENNPILSPDGKLIAYTGFMDNGRSFQVQQLYVMNNDGSNNRLLTAELDRSVSNLQWSRDGKGLYFSYDDHGKKHVGFVSLNGKLDVLTDVLGGQSIGRPYTSGDYTVMPDGQVVVTASIGTQPADLALVKNDDIIPLTDLNSDVFAHKTLNAPELLTVNSSVDERELQAWVVKPPGFDPTKKYPMILEIHGGPHTAYGPEFSAEVQLFAAAGYVVIYGNPRGSTSQGSEFANTIDKNYPSNDYNDLMDMVDGLIAKGFVDEDNLFVTGGSGGGVLTAWIIGNTDRFAGAVVAKPVINWISMIGTSDIYTFMTRYWFTDLPWDDVDQYWSRSPLRLVGNVTTPTMVLTGELDVRTPMGESEQYYGALRLEGVDSALVRIQGAYHGITAKPSNLANKVGYILAWFERHQTR